MAECRKLRKDCPADADDKPKEPCPPVAFCAGNQMVTFDGECLSVEPRAVTIPDGTFSQITFSGGCIVGVGQAPVPTYTPNACCGSPGETVGNLPDLADIISNDPSNLLKQTPTGLAVQPVFRGRGVVVTGSGTPTDPFTITTSDSSVGISVSTSTPEAIEVTYDAYTSTYSVGLKSNKMSGIYGPFTVNDYGQIVAYDAQDAPITAIQGDPYIVVDKVGDGHIVLNFDINRLRKEITPTGLGADDTTGAYGGRFETADGKYVYYDNTGRITSVKAIPTMDSGTDDGGAAP
ncbi:hypothetical protein V757_11220 [Pelistega indica]|uniref:Uncharacterized protein n=1 Tax=Pelistega indica TaxID=1414851 RepID=V8FVW4_9BURK|nr:hypothetical protein [Pelistega indica]ETD67552.1 hypothetical protein V757_11220 [Pelistega indica]